MPVSRMNAKHWIQGIIIWENRFIHPSPHASL